MSHHHAVSNEERYRCFVYEKISSLGKCNSFQKIYICRIKYEKGLKSEIIITGGSSKDAEYKLAQSGDATCNGLDSAEVSQIEINKKKTEPKLIEKLRLVRV